MSALFSTAVAAEGLESTDPRLVGERPNASGAPTLITVSVYLFDINEIDDVNQRFSVDLFAYVTWQDSRLALPEAQQSGQVRTLPLNEIRTPRVLVLNDRGLSLQLPRVAEVDAWAMSSSSNAFRASWRRSCSSRNSLSTFSVCR